MRKRLIIAMGVIVLTGLGALFLLQSYKLPLIQSIVVNALLQKAPPDYPTERIEEAFRSAYQAATGQNRESEYLTELIILSQRLEKVQRLKAGDVDTVLSEIDREFPLD